MTLTCEQCGERYTGNPGRRYCSQRCSGQAWATTRPRKPRKPKATPKKAKDRAGIVGARWLKVRAIIRQLVKDGRPCAICHRPIDLRPASQGGPMPRTRWSFSVDHREPRSKGGDYYALSNLRPAHYGCNSSRGNGTKRMRTTRQETSRW